MVIGALLWVAAAGDPPTGDAPEPTASEDPAGPAPPTPPAVVEELEAEEEDEESYYREIVVYGQRRADAARQQVIEDLEGLGYRKQLERDGAVVMRHEQAWKGDVWLHDDGWMRIKRQPARFEAPGNEYGERNSAGAWAGCILLPFRCVRLGGQTVSKRKFSAVETRTAEAINGDVSTWSDRVADLRVAEKLAELPDRLTRLWQDGVPLDGSEAPLATHAERRAALLAFWESRTDNVWGEAIRAGVEGFIRGEVQPGEHPFTDEELRAFNRRSRAGRPLDLERKRR